MSTGNRIVDALVGLCIVALLALVIYGVQSKPVEPAKEQPIQVSLSFDEWVDEWRVAFDNSSISAFDREWHDGMVRWRGTIYQITRYGDIYYMRGQTKRGFYPGIAVTTTDATKLDMKFKPGRLYPVEVEGRIYSVSPHDVQIQAYSIKRLDGERVPINP